MPANVRDPKKTKKFREKVAAILREAVQGRTLSELAREARVGQSQLYGALRAKSGLSEDRLKRLEDVLEIPRGKLLRAGGYKVGEEREERKEAVMPEEKLADVSFKDILVFLEGLESEGVTRADFSAIEDKNRFHDLAIAIKVIGGLT